MLFAPLTLLFGPQATLTTLLTLGFVVAGGLHYPAALLPWHYLQALPLLDQSLPNRFSLLADGAAAAVLAFALDLACGARRTAGPGPAESRRPGAPHPGHRAYRPAAHAGRSDHADPGHSGRNLTARYLTDLWLGTKGAAAPSTAALRSTLAYWQPERRRRGDQPRLAAGPVPPQRPGAACPP